MNHETLLRLESMVLAFIGSRVPDESELRMAVIAMATPINADAETQEAVLRRLEAKLRVSVEIGVAISQKNHKLWLQQRAASISPFYWDRYSRFLTTRKNWPTLVTSTLGKTTDEILDLLGNPADDGAWARRGLVLGDVQSGKTATYTSLICKAADAGYRFIVLLTGTLENLRRQTQERIDEGFVGFDSSGELRKVKEGKRLGVGLIDANRQATVFTSRSSDFSSATVQALGLNLAALSEPAIVVLKKNKYILENLQQWLKDYNSDGSGTIKTPLLLIDDEADNASLNTAAEGGVTAINAQIRGILKLFKRNSYVGFTATPFANIFVDPDTQDAMLGDDLFPRDFIYSLNAPSNYVGPVALFGGSEADSKYGVTDAWGTFPRGHKQTLVVNRLPESLWHALDCFLVANAIRDLRKEGPTHRSMLVNVSRFTKVQNSVESLILVRLDEIKAAVRNFSKLKPKDALQDSLIAGLHLAWKEQYSDAGFTWAEVQAALQDAVIPVVTTAVNQSRGAKALDYKKHEATGLRVVAVGGNSLSRGFTLEGLMTSYFLRTSLMYDTLLQMGRWFGYRDGYADLCRLWMTNEARGWYSHITEATQELRDQIADMRDNDRTPGDFGLAVRSHPDSLIVTAHNKMRTAKEVERLVSVSSRLFETVELRADDRTSNFSEVMKFVANLKRPWGEPFRGSSPFMRGVPAKSIAALVRDFKVAGTDLLFQPTELAALIESVPDPRLAAWDVLFPAGSEKRTQQIGTTQLPFERRMVEKRRSAWVVSGSKRRVASRGDEAVGLDDEAKRTAEIASELARKAKSDKAGIQTSEEPKRASVGDKYYRMQRSTPLLMVHFIQPFDEEEPHESLLPDPQSPPLCALSLSFCPFDDENIGQRLKYRINLVKLRELYGDEADESDGDDDREAQA